MSPGWFFEALCQCLCGNRISQGFSKSELMCARRSIGMNFSKPVFNQGKKAKLDFSYF